MSVLDNTGVVDRSASISKVKALPTLIRALNVFGQAELINTDTVQFDVKNDGNIYVLEDHLRGVQEKNHTEQEDYNIHTLPLMQHSVSHTLTRQQLAGVKQFDSEGEEQLSRAIVGELEKQSNHLDITKEYLMANALIKNQVVSNIHGTINYGTEFSISRPSEALNNTAAGDLLTGLRSAMKKSRGGLNGRGLANGYTMLVSEGMWDFLVTSTDLQNTYENGQAFPNGNPLLLNIPEIAGQSMFCWGNIDIILWDQSFPAKDGTSDEVMSADTGILFPKVSGGSLGRFFAGPSSQIDWQSAPVRERYAYQFMGEKKRHIDVESEASWLPLVTMPGAVVDLTYS